MTADLLILGVSLVVALVMVVAGIVRVVQIGLVLRTRIVRYAELPIVAEAATARLRIGRATARLETVPDLVARVELSLATFREAATVIARSIATVTALVRDLPRIVLGR